MKRDSSVIAAGCIALAVCAGAACPAVAAPAYGVVPLGTLGGSFSGANALNDAGLVAGSAATGPAAASAHAFLYRDGAMRDLGAFGGASQAAGVNASGQVTGSAQLGNSAAFHAFRYDGTMTDLGTLTGSGATSGEGINDRGDVVGTYDPFNGPLSGFIVTDAMRAIGPPGSSSAATAINNAGAVVGAFIPLFRSDPAHAYLYDGSYRDLSPTADTWSRAQAINDAGMVAGAFAAPGAPFASAFLYSDGLMRSISSFDGPSEARGINEAGDVVGSVNNADYSFREGFVYTAGRMFLLDALLVESDWHIVLANDINNAGQIAATGCLPTAGCDYLHWQALRLDPVFPIPAPSTLALAICAFGWLVLARAARGSSHAGQHQAEFCSSAGLQEARFP